MLHKIVCTALALLSSCGHHDDDHDDHHHHHHHHHHHRCSRRSPKLFLTQGCKLNPKEDKREFYAGVRQKRCIIDVPQFPYERRSPIQTHQSVNARAKGIHKEGYPLYTLESDSRDPKPDFHSADRGIVMVSRSSGAPGNREAWTDNPHTYGS
ncbi:hypothetical protein PV328_008881 [Microctonus aethiopoides]|uniref:Uncharacterized protein n=1 Tax=Microctonus aethiopoides TaxID=144406 RepID=A0AA39FKS8_9HYME|nr:hypothetical protein PV328_008881 [Microctonus aethiopoides]